MLFHKRQDLANCRIWQIAGFGKLQDLANPARKLQDLANPARKPNSKHFLWAPWGAH